MAKTCTPRTTETGVGGPRVQGQPGNPRDPWSRKKKIKKQIDIHLNIEVLSFSTSCNIKITMLLSNVLKIQNYSGRIKRHSKHFYQEHKTP